MSKPTRTKPERTLSNVSSCSTVYETPRHSISYDEARTKKANNEEIDAAADEAVEPSNLLAVEAEQGAPTESSTATEVEPNPFAHFSKKKRWFLLLVFSLSAIRTIDMDPYLFSVFACFLLFWGRVADLFSPKMVFVGGFTCLGVTCAIVSVCPEMISFFIFRGLCGLFCSATIPAAFRLIMMVFEGEERAMAITVFSLTGAVANSAGLILAGFFAFDTAEGQTSSWRWYFRFIALLAMPFAAIAYYNIPTTASSVNYTTSEKWKRFDLPGCAILLSATLLFILSLTLGATYGWKTAAFLVPFLLCWPLGIGFYFWEKRLEEGHALVPPSTWGIRNLTLLLFISISAFAYWPSTQVPLIERWQTVNGEKAIMTAVRLLPQGLSSVIPIFVLPYVPQKWKASRYYIVITYTIVASMLIPLVFSHGSIDHGDYWRYYFPSFVIASFFGAAAFSGISVSVMVSVPSEMSGVAGALLQVFLQIGGAAVFSIQAGLLTIYPGSYSNFHNLQASWWFFLGWYMANVMLVLVLFRNPKKGDVEEAEAQAEQAVSEKTPAVAREGEGGAKFVGGEEVARKPSRMSAINKDPRPGIARVQSLV